MKFIPVLSFAFQIPSNIAYSIIWWLTFSGWGKMRVVRSLVNWEKVSKPKLEGEEYLILHTEAFLGKKLGNSHYGFALLVNCFSRRVQFIKAIFYMRELISYLFLRKWTLVQYFNSILHGGYKFFIGRASLKPSRSLHHILHAKDVSRSLCDICFISF